MPDDAEETSIQVNFARPMPLFPLDKPVLLPHQVLPLHIFEPRYRQLVEHALDGAGQLASAVFQGDAWKTQYHGRPPLRPAVCVGQILQHEKLSDGRYNILVQGICRARIIRETVPCEGTLYREAMLQPVGVGEDPEEHLYGVRERFAELLADGPLTQLAASDFLLARLRDESIPMSALLEFVSFRFITDPALRYRLLAEPDAGARAELIESELLHLQRLVRRAANQRPELWPKGCSWN